MTRTRDDMSSASHSPFTLVRCVAISLAMLAAIGCRKPPAAEGKATAPQMVELGEEYLRRTPQVLCCLALALVAGPADDASAARAEQLLKEAGNPEVPPAWFADGLLRQRKKDHSGAQAAFRKVLAANARNERAQYALAMAYRDAGDRPAAQTAMARHDQFVKTRQRLKQLQQQVTAHPKSAAAVQAYGIALYEEGSYDIAEPQFARWVELEPTHREPKGWLAKTRQRMGRE
jgi:tetratricopeptide (TPR) repeat protein